MICRDQAKGRENRQRVGSTFLAQEGHEQRPGGGQGRETQGEYEKTSPGNVSCSGLVEPRV